MMSVSDSRSRPVTALVWLMLLFIPQASAQGIWCDWFGLGCAEGSSNETLIDLGRSSTNKGFLFFSGDSAQIERSLQFAFSDESVKKKDRLDLVFNEGLLPSGSKVYVNGELIAAGNRATVVADAREKNVNVRWVIPPTGDDVTIDGNIDIVPYGFERAGNRILDSANVSQPLPMLRIQGKVNNDWHWFKRLNFWFWTLLLTIVCIYKFFLAPVFLHRRSDLRRLRVMLYREGVSLPIWEHEYRKIYGSIHASLGQKVPGQGVFSRFMNGRVVTATNAQLPAGLVIEIFRGKREPFKGKKIQVTYGAGFVKTMFENETEKERTIQLPNTDLKITFIIK